MSRAQKSLSVNVAASLAVSTASLPDGTEGQSYSAALAASGGTTPYSWRLAAGSGALPSGLVLGADGTISGTPTVPGTYTFTVEVLDANG